MFYAHGQAILPSIDDTLASLPPNGSLFTKIDLKGAFNLLRLFPEAEDLSSFVTKFGKFKYRVFGLKNAPASRHGEQAMCHSPQDQKQRHSQTNEPARFVYWLGVREAPE
jgi:hypothetical protein